MEKLSRAPAFSRVLPVLLLLAGMVGLMASFALTYDKIHVLTNPSYIPACNINPIFSCGSVMKTEQASLLGVPNTIFGIMAYTALVTFSVLWLTGVKYRRRVWLFAQLGVTIGLFFMHYLFFEGVYRINAICPWCFLVWMVTIPTFWYVTIYNLKQGYTKLPHRAAGLAKFLVKNHANVLVTWYAVIAVLLLQHFWYYWSTLL